MSRLVLPKYPDLEFLLNQVETYIYKPSYESYIVTGLLDKSNHEVTQNIKSQKRLNESTEY